MNTECPRVTVQQLLQLFDKRFFQCVGPLPENELDEVDEGRSTLGAILAASYCRYCPGSYNAYYNIYFLGYIIWN